MWTLNIVIILLISSINLRTTKSQLSSSSVLVESSMQSSMVSSIASISSSLIPMQSSIILGANVSSVMVSSVAPITNSSIPIQSSIILGANISSMMLSSVALITNSSIPMQSSNIPGANISSTMVSSAAPISSTVIPMQSSSIFVDNVASTMVSSAAPISSSVIPMQSSSIFVDNVASTMISSAAPISSTVIPMQSSSILVDNVASTMVSSAAPISSSVIPMQSSSIFVDNVASTMVSSAAPISSSPIPMQSSIILGGNISSNIVSSAAPISTSPIPMQSSIILGGNISSNIVSSAAPISSSPIPMQSSIILGGNISSNIVPSAAPISTSPIPMQSSIILGGNISSNIVPSAAPISTSPIPMQSSIVMVGNISSTMLSSVAPISNSSIPLQSSSSLPPMSTQVVNETATTPSSTLAPPSLQLSQTSFIMAARSDQESTVSCTLNPPQSGIVPNWQFTNGTVVSNNSILRLSIQLFPSSMEFVCVVTSLNLQIRFNYTIINAGTVLIEINSLNTTVDGSVAAVLSDQLIAVAASVSSTDDAIGVIASFDNLLKLTDPSTLNGESIRQLANNVLTASNSVLNVSTNGTGRMQVDTTVTNLLNELSDLITGLPDSVNDTISIATQDITLQSQVLTNTNSDVSFSITSPNSRTNVTINTPSNLIGTNTRITLIVSDHQMGGSVSTSGSVSIGVSVGGVIRSSILSADIQGVSRDTVLNPPIEMRFPRPDSINNSTSDPVCVFLNEDTQLWETTGVETVVINDQVICRTSHLTSFAVLEVMRVVVPEETANLALRIISYILLALSLIALCISLILFILSGRRFFDVDMNRMYFNYALALMIAIVAFIFGVNLGVLDNIFCIIVSLLVHYIWLAVFTWGLAIALFITYMVTLGVLKKRKLFWPLFALAWVLPLPIVLLTFIFGMIRGNFARQDEQCFLTLEYIWSLLGPIFVIIVLNTICYVIAIVRMIMISMNKVEGENKVNSSMLKRALISGVILLPVLGIPWIVILIDFIFAQYAVTSPIFEWVFLILIGPSGFIFLIVFTLFNKAVLQTLHGKICGRDEPVGLSATTVEGKVITNPQSKEFTQNPEPGIELENVYTEPRDIIYSNKSVGDGENIERESIKDQEATGEVFPEKTGATDQSKETSMI